MIHELLIVTGQDRPGIVGVVSRLLAQKKINLEDLRMSILEGEFAMMVVARIPDNQVRISLARDLRALEKEWRLTIFQCPLGALKKNAGVRKKSGKGAAATWIIRVLGKDKTGIVASVSRVLAQHECNITDLQCRILGSGARALYTMVLECSVPSKIPQASLKNALTRLQKKLGVEIRIQNADLIQL